MNDDVKRMKESYDALVKKEHELSAQLTRVKSEQKPYVAFLKEAGVIEPKNKRAKGKAPVPPQASGSSQQ